MAQQRVSRGSRDTRAPASVMGMSPEEIELAFDEMGLGSHQAREDFRYYRTLATRGRSLVKYTTRLSAYTESQ